MKAKIVFCSAISAFLVLVARADEAHDDLSTALLGKWTQEMVGAATGGAVLNITRVDPATGQITAKYRPPGGPAGGQEFDVVGWVSSAPPQEKRDNVATVSFTVSLRTYGSITSETGYLKGNKSLPFGTTCGRTVPSTGTIS